MNVVYEIAKEAPVEEVVALYRSAGWWKDGDAAELVPALVRGSFAVAFAKVDGRLVGMGRVLSDGVSDAYIQDVVVLPEWRGKGIGAGLVSTLTAFCRERGLGWIGLIAEPGRQAFYERLGFGKLGDGYVPMLFGKKNG